MTQTPQDHPSASTPPRSPSKVTLISERNVESASPPPTTLNQLISAATGATTPTTTPQLSQEYVHRAAWKAGVLGTINVLIRVVSARAIVLVAVGGDIVLTSTALVSPDPWRLGALAIYSLAVVVPVVWLASRH